ncbi:uncharacterized protein LOC134667659 [Cydia fagiglandana]|uniref:uncharacterized protein LOC134667659 n=1 Tax=Cydia fagiglandana TaxID=1458189 RepID=UPI002FEE3356
MEEIQATFVLPGFTPGQKRRALEQLAANVCVKLRRLDDVYEMNSNDCTNKIKVEPIVNETSNTEDLLEDYIDKAEEFNQVFNEELIIKEEESDSDCDPLLEIKKEREDSPITDSTLASSTLKGNDLEPNSNNTPLPYLQECREDRPKSETLVPTFRNFPRTDIKTFLHGPWTKYDNKIQKIIFTRKQALLKPSTNNPAHYFEYFIDDEYLKDIVVATNQHAFRKINFQRDSCYSRDWKDVTVAEFKIFIGLLLHTGTAKFKNVVDYWRPHRLYKSCFPEYMTSQRFAAIMYYLTYPGIEAEKRINHLKFNHPMADHFNEVMDNIYYPGRNMSVCINEIEIDSGVVQNLPLKIISLHEPGGPIVRMIMDTRRNVPLDVENVTCKMLKGKFDVGHAVYVDSAATLIIPSFAQYLLQRGTYCTGIIDERRFLMPEELANARLKHNESISLFYDGLHVGKHEFEGVAKSYVTTEFKKEKGNPLNRMPEPLRVYKEVMAETSDPHNDMLNYLPCEINKWVSAKKLFVYTLLLSIYNAHKLSNMFSGTKLNYHNYRLLLLEHLLPATAHSPVKQHMLVKIPKTSYRINKDRHIIQTTRRNCKNCTKNNIRVSTTYQCKGCDSNPALCFPCFFKLHSCTLIE